MTENRNDWVLTLDIDWAPDWVIDYVAQILIENKTKATWFVTHHSNAIARLRENSELFELGIHPNLLSGSTHGSTEDEVLTHIKQIVPEAISMRTHGLYQSSNFLVKAAKEYGILIDSSLFLPRAKNLAPHKFKWHNCELWRIPYFWEDDLEMFEDDPIWTLSHDKLFFDGLKVFDFHPIHIVLNTEKFSRYEKLRNIQAVNTWSKELVESHINQGEGPRTLFLELARKLANKGKHIREIVEAQIQNTGAGNVVE